MPSVPRGIPDEVASALLRPAEGSFSPAEVAGLPGTARRLLETAIAPGTPLADSARLEMHGRIRLRGWTRFRASEVLAPHRGFVWAARAGLVRGYDRYLHGEGEMRWRLLGIVPVVRASGPDVARSAAGRLAGEAAWLPSALLPRFGVSWSAPDAETARAAFVLDGRAHTLDLRLDAEGRIASCAFDRWGDPDGTGDFALHRFGLEATAHRTFAGLTVPSAGRAGWHFGTARWPEGAFFEYELAALRPA